ncbi:Adhesion G protein-coupled receptor B3 [Armadillidium vulgare]|nr:Adhesion G protein-coupled receptor B3 [Armadillidium vulgare]
MSGPLGVKMKVLSFCQNNTKVGDSSVIHTSKKKSPLNPAQVMLGCHKTSTNKTYGGFNKRASMDEFSLWREALVGEEKDKIMGGFRDEYADMSDEELRELLNKINTGDSAQADSGANIVNMLIDEEPDDSDGGDSEVSSTVNTPTEDADLETFKADVKMAMRFLKIDLLPETIPEDQAASQMHGIPFAAVLLNKKNKKNWEDLQRDQDDLGASQTIEAMYLIRSSGMRNALTAMCLFPILLLMSIRPHEKIQNRSRHINLVINVIQLDMPTVLSIKPNQLQPKSKCLEGLSSHIAVRRCVLWNANQSDFGVWDPAGCQVVETSAEFTKCACDRMGTFVVLTEEVEPKEVKEEPKWLVILKYVLYGLSALFILLYMLVVFIAKDLKDQLHLMGVNIGIAFIAGSAVIICTDFESITNDRHVCVVLGTLLQFFYGALGFWGVAIGHASFRAITRGVIGGNLIPACMMCWGVSLLLTGIPFIEFLEDLGTDPRCFISWENVPKYPFFIPQIVCSIFSMFYAIVILTNLSTPALRKRKIEVKF